jgi:hypothetical protein
VTPIEQRNETLNRLREELNEAKVLVSSLHDSLDKATHEFYEGDRVQFSFGRTGVVVIRHDDDTLTVKVRDGSFVRPSKWACYLQEG